MRMTSDRLRGFHWVHFTAQDVRLSRETDEQFPNLKGS